MSKLWTPPVVSRELRDATAEHTAQVLGSLVPEGVVEAYWNPRLRDLDPALSLVRAMDGARVAGLRPGFWHVMRLVTGVPPTLLPVIGPDGCFVEPSSHIETWLREGDLQNAAAMEARRRGDDLVARRKAREVARERDERVAQMTEHVRALTRSHVSMSDARPWSNAAKDSGRGGGQ